MDDKKCREQIRWMERQADTLAARVQMPKSCVLSELLDLVHFSRNSGKNLKMEDVVMSLARHFHTSKGSTEIRLKELEFNDINDIYHYADSCYSWGNEIDILKNSGHEDYDIQPCQLQHVLLKRDFREDLKKGNYLYVEDRLCINEPLYIRTENGKKHLTEYALLHPEECCVRFSRILEGNDNEFHLGYFAKKNVGAIGNPAFPKNLSPEAAHMKSILKELKDLPLSAGETLSRHMKNKDVTIEQLVSLTGISDRTIKRYRKESSMKLNNLVAICVALHLDPMFSKDLIRKAGFTLNEQKLEHVYFEFILNHMYERDVPDCNNFLIESGVASLTSLKEALVCA